MKAASAPLSQATDPALAGVVMTGGCESRTVKVAAVVSAKPHASSAVKTTKAD